MRNYGIARGAEWTPERIAAITRNTLIVIVGGIVLGLFAVAASAYYVLFVVAAAALILLIAWRFEAALVVYALVAFIPYGETPDIAVGGSGIGKGVYVSEVMLGFVLVIWFARYLLHGLPKNRISSGFYVPIALYLAYSVLNVANSFIFWDWHVNLRHQYPHVNGIDLGFRFLSAGALAMMSTTVSNRGWLKWITVAVLVPGLYNLANVLAGRVIPIVAPWWTLMTYLPAAYCCTLALDRSVRPAKRALAAAVIAISVFAVLLRSISWVSGWLGLLSALAAISFIKNKRVFVLGLLVTVVVVAMYGQYFHQAVVVESEEGGDYARFDLMRGAWRYATTFPLGVGLGNYRSYNSFYYGEKWGTTSYSSAHGIYAQHLSEMGIPGFLLFLNLLISGYLWMLSSYRKMPEGPSKRFVLAAMGQMVGIAAASLIGDYIIPTYHNGGLCTFSTTLYSWLIWGLAIAHVRISRQEQDGSLDCDS